MEQIRPAVADVAALRVTYSVAVEPAETVTLESVAVTPEHPEGTMVVDAALCDMLAGSESDMAISADAPSMTSPKQV
jgi:hypothetical protein